MAYIKMIEENEVTVVSSANQCTYCKYHHSDALKRVTKDTAFADQIRNDYNKTNISQAEKVMLKLAEQLTTNPAHNYLSLVNELKKKGFADESILAPILSGETRSGIECHFNLTTAQ